MWDLGSNNIFYYNILCNVEHISFKFSKKKNNTKNVSLLKPLILRRMCGKNAQTAQTAVTQIADYHYRKTTNFSSIIG